MECLVSLQQIDEFARTFWEYAEDQKRFALHGDMGAGKTTLVGALCRQKGVVETISSPTFSVINQYRYVEKGEEKFIYHMDLYRLKDEAEVIQAGVEECLYSGAICFVEWPERAPSLFEDQTIHIYIDTVNEEERHLNIPEPPVVSKNNRNL